MPVAVQQAQQRPSGFDQNLDRIAKGLQIAKSLFDIPVGIMDRNRQIAKEEEQAKLAQEDRAAQQKTRGLQDQALTLSIAEKEAAALRAPKTQELDDEYKRAQIKNMQAGGGKDPLLRQLTALRVEDMLRNRQEADEKKKFASSFEGKLKNLSPTDRVRYDNSLMAMKALGGMHNALRGGQKTWSLIGDNDFTMNETAFAEAMGRMQSGGAINKDEEARFLRMAPKAGDSPEIRQKKLKQMEGELLSRLQTLGLSADDVGYVASDFDLNPKSKPTGGFNSKKVVAQQLTPEDQQALDWANKNPGDPRAAQIKALHGAK